MVSIPCCLMLLLVTADLTGTSKADENPESYEGLLVYEDPESPLPVSCSDIWLAFNVNELLPLHMFTGGKRVPLDLPTSPAILHYPVDVDGDGVKDEVMVGGGCEPGGSYNVTSSRIFVFELAADSDQSVVQRANGLIEALHQGVEPKRKEFVSSLGRVLDNHADTEHLGRYADTFIEFGSVQGWTVMRSVSLTASEVLRRPLDLKDGTNRNALEAILYPATIPGAEIVCAREVTLGVQISSK